MRREPLAVTLAFVDDLIAGLGEAVEGQASQGRGDGDGHVDVGGVDAGDTEGQRRSVAAPHRVLPELITKKTETGEEMVYGATPELAVRVSKTEAERKSARFILEWLRAKRRCLQLES